MFFRKQTTPDVATGPAHGSLPERSLVPHVTLANAVIDALKAGPTGFWTGRKDGNVDAHVSGTQFQLGSHIQEGAFSQLLLLGRLHRDFEVTIKTFNTKRSGNSANEVVPNQYEHNRPLFVLMGQVSTDVIGAHSRLGEHEVRASVLLSSVTHAALFVPKEEAQIPAWSKALIAHVDSCNLKDQLAETRGGEFIEGLRKIIQRNGHSSELIGFAKRFG